MLTKHTILCQKNKLQNLNQQNYENQQNFYENLGANFETTVLTRFYKTFEI